MKIRSGMKHSKTHCSNIYSELRTKCEKLVELYNESKSKVIIEIEVDEIPYEFTVDISIENYEYEEETNSASYDFSVFCVSIPSTKNECVNEFLSSQILFETIYKTE